MQYIINYPHLCAECRNHHESWSDTVSCLRNIAIKEFKRTPKQEIDLVDAANKLEKFLEIQVHDYVPKTLYGEGIKEGLNIALNIFKIYFR